MDLIKVEIEQLRHQIEILDAIYIEQITKTSYCDSLKIYIIEYYDHFLHKLRCCKGKAD